MSRHEQYRPSTRALCTYFLFMWFLSPSKKNRDLCVSLHTHRHTWRNGKLQHNIRYLGGRSHPHSIIPTASYDLSQDERYILHKIYICISRSWWKRFERKIVKVSCFFLTRRFYQEKEIHYFMNTYKTNRWHCLFQNNCLSDVLNRMVQARATVVFYYN